MSLQTNPLHDGLRIEPTPGPTTLVIFGASGDLTRRKLLPALYQPVARAAPAARSSRSSVSRERADRRRGFRDAVPRQPARVRDMTRGRQMKWRSRSPVALLYVHGELDDPALYAATARASSRRSTATKACCSTWRFRRRSTARSSSSSGRQGLSSAPEPAWRRIIVEKPFGTDLTSARELNRLRARALRRGSGLPHRSLSRQGNGSEPAWCSGSPTACSSRSGTGATSITCRSPRPKPWASSAAPRTTSVPARCATWCRTISCSC